MAILYHLKTARATGLDISEKALEIAGKNAQNHGVSDRLKLDISDVFDALPSGKQHNFDLIVSNPPYIPAEDFAGLQPEVRLFDPMNALTDGRDGLSIIRKIIKDSPDFLNPGGFLLVEIGINQSENVRKMFSPHVWSKVEIVPDLQGILRMAVGELGRPGDRETGGQGVQL